MRREAWRYAAPGPATSPDDSFFSRALLLQPATTSLTPRFSSRPLTSVHKCRYMSVVETRTCLATPSRGSFEDNDRERQFMHANNGG